MQLLQYQESVQGIPSSLAPERTTPDKWQPNTNTPQSNWQKAALYSVAAIMPFVSFVNLGNQPERATPDKWQPETNRPVFDVRRAQYDYPTFFVDGKQFTLRERTTPDKWQPETNKPVFDVKRQQQTYPSSFFNPLPIEEPANIQMAGIYQTPVPYLTVKHTEYLFPSFFTDPNSLTQKEVAKVFSSEPVTLSFLRNTQYQGLAFPTKFAIAEIVTLDKWNHDTDRPLLDLKRQQYTYPFTFFYPQDLEVTRFENPGEFSRNVDRVYDRARNQYLYPAYSANILPIEETADFQDAGIYQTNVPLFSAKHTEYLYPASVIDPKQFTQKERTTPDKWQAKTNEPLFDIKRNQYLYQPFSVDTNQLTHSESAKVFSQQSLVLSFLRSTQYQSLTFLNRGATSQEAPTPDKWFKETQRPVWDVKRQQYLFPTFFIDPSDLTLRETAKVFSSQPVVIVTLRGTQYQGLALINLGPAASETVTLDKWFKETQKPLFDIKRHQTLYPLFTTDAFSLVPHWYPVIRTTDDDWSDVNRDADASYAQVTRSSDANYSEVTRSSNASYNPVNRASDDDWHLINRES